MKYTLILFSLFLYFSVSFLGCGSDNPVTNNQNPPPASTVDTITLAQIDSIYFNETYPLTYNSFSYLSTVQVDTLYVKFTYHIFGIRSLLTFKIDGDTLIDYQRNITSNTSFDTTFSNTFIVNKSNFINYFSIYPNSSFINHNEFASLRNIKLWYIKRS